MTVPAGDESIVSVAEKNPYEAILTVSGAARRQVTQEVYDDVYRKRPAADFGKLPSKSRLKKIAVLRAAIGRGHKSILELGCGNGDLTWALVDCAEKIVGVDVSPQALADAKRRESLWHLSKEQAARVEFKPLSAVQLSFADHIFDCALSTSMVEHLHPDDLLSHFREVKRVLRPGGKYLIWCPNSLGHHKDRLNHFSMLSYAEWIEKMTEAGFHGFVSTLANGMHLVDARYKVFLEKLLTSLRIKILWSHLGVRNVFLVAGT
ncbi:MAG: class I SAM-dependent methyltransferase [Candidatus Binatia bacterium]